MFKRARVGNECTWDPASSSESPQNLEHVVQLNESLYSLHKATDVMARGRMEVLFFHGLQFGEYKHAHLRTWESGDGSQIWPNSWLVERFPHADIYSVSYSACVRNSSLHGNLALYNVGENLIYDLMHANIGQVSECPVVLVGHSFGGLIIKQLSLEANKIAQMDFKHNNFLKNVKGIFFYGTPHHGIPFIKKAMHLLNGPFLQYVMVLSNETARLNYEFDRLCDSYKWQIDGLGESLPTKLGPFDDIVVPEASARNGQRFNIVEGAAFHKWTGTHVPPFELDDVAPSPTI